MNHTLVFDTEAEAIACSDEINALLGYPNPVTKTERYTEPVMGEDGKWYVPTGVDCPGSVKAKLSAARKIDPTDIKFDSETGKLSEIKGVKLAKKAKN